MIIELLSLKKNYRYGRYVKEHKKDDCTIIECKCIKCDDKYEALYRDRPATEAESRKLSRIKMQFSSYYTE